jgi:site-specific recombinase XerD
MNHPLAPFIKRFFSHYLPVQKGLSLNTVCAYRDAVKLLLGYAADTLRKPVDELAAEDLTETLVLNFLDQMEQGRGCSSSTRNARLAAIRTFFAFLAREEPILMVQCQQIRTIPLKRTEHRTIDYLEEKEMQAVFTALDVNCRTGIRDRALLLLLYNTGARVSEIVALRLTDLRLDDSAQVKLLGKGKKERSCPLWPETVAAVEAYLKQRDPIKPDTERVFLNANGSPITRFGIRHVTCKYGTLVQAQKPSFAPKPLNPHTIRHTTAMHLLRAGNDINMVSYWLGHADINTTHIYVEIDMETKRKMIDEAGAPKLNKKAPWQKPHVLEWLNRLAKNHELCAVNYCASGRNEQTGGRLGLNFT